MQIEVLEVPGHITLAVTQTHAQATCKCDGKCSVPLEHISENLPLFVEAHQPCSGVN